MSRTKGPTVQLLGSRECPHVEPTHLRLKEILASEGLPSVIEELDLDDQGTPAALRNWGSPTVLVDGADVAAGQKGRGASCRLYAGSSNRGTPPDHLIRAAIRNAATARASAFPRVAKANTGPWVLGSALGAIGAASAATLASLCCVGPAAIALLGVGAVATAHQIAPYRPYFLMSAFVLLGLGYWRSYRPAKIDGHSCPTPTGRAVRLTLWCSLAGTLTALLVPLWLT